MITTTLSALKEHHPCELGWDKLITYLGPDWPSDRPIPLLTILDNNGLSDTLWAFRAVEGDDARRLLASYLADVVDRASETAKVMDERTLAVPGVLRRWVREASDGELEAAADAAWAAAAAADAAWAAADCAASAAHAAADCAARGVDVAADCAARVVDVAAHAAAAAASLAATRAATRAAYTAGAAAADAERQWQADRLREYLTHGLEVMLSRAVSA